MPQEIDYLIGKFKASKHPDFRVINNKFSDSTPHYVLKEVGDSFEKMAAKAKKDSITIFAVSGFRSFIMQKQIWEEKFSGARLANGLILSKEYPHDFSKRVENIIKFSAAPGTSRHHWGTDIDINSVEPEYFKSKDGKKVYDWLCSNAKAFGFFQPYTENRKTGYVEEKWHWSYFPISSKLLSRYIELITIDDIKGFQGDNLLPSSFIEDYVLGINNNVS